MFLGLKHPHTHNITFSLKSCSCRWLMAFTVCSLSVSSRCLRFIWPSVKKIQIEEKFCYQRLHGTEEKVIIFHSDCLCFQFYIDNTNRNTKKPCPRSASKLFHYRRGQHSNTSRNESFILIESTSSTNDVDVLPPRGRVRKLRDRPFRSDTRRTAHH